LESRKAEYEKTSQDAQFVRILFLRCGNNAVPSKCNSFVIRTKPRTIKTLSSDLHGALPSPSHQLSTGSAKGITFEVTEICLSQQLENMPLLSILESIFPESSPWTLHWRTTTHFGKVELDQQDGEPLFEARTDLLVVFFDSPSVQE
jgi:hypothetical protein